MNPEGAKDASPSCRDIFDNFVPLSCTNVGLWLDRFVPTLGSKGGPQQFLDFVSGKESLIRVSPQYTAYYERWKRALDRPHVYFGEASVLGRMVVGLGAESVLETSISLHRTYGVPMIPGSALKGLASATAHRHFAGDSWCKNTKGKEQGQSHKIMFGDTTTAGYVTFYDALFIPRADNKLPLDLDVMTVHHRDYYGTGKKPPADWDSPVPVPFLTANGSYLVAIEGPREWALVAWDILKKGLQEEGIGAKTAAGYGRMKLDRPECLRKEDDRVQRARQRIEDLVKGFTWKSNAKDILGEFLQFLGDEAVQPFARAELLSLYGKDKPYWRDWRKKHDQGQWDALQALDLLPPADVPVQRPDAERAESVTLAKWERGLAWIAPDNKKRPMFFFRLGDKGPEERNVKDVDLLGDGLRLELEAAQQKPVVVEVLRDGKKIKQVRRPQ